jgi:hypothetical protein
MCFQRGRAAPSRYSSPLWQSASAVNRRLGRKSLQSVLTLRLVNFEVPMHTENRQKSVSLRFVGLVVGILALAAAIAGGWYYLRGRKTNHETPQHQSNQQINSEHMAQTV